jgi:hypothetical protein
MESNGSTDIKNSITGCISVIIQIDDTLLIDNKAVDPPVISVITKYPPQRGKQVEGEGK